MLPFLSYSHDPHRSCLLFVLNTVCLLQVSFLQEQSPQLLALLGMPVSQPRTARAAPTLLAMNNIFFLLGVTHLA